MPEWNPQARALFLQANEISSPDERRNFLEAHCAGDNALRAEVESLLAASESAGNFLESPVVAVENKARHGLSSTADLTSTHEKPGTLVGRYKLREQIGEGGMGTVWIAEQTEPLRRKVALKLVKAGMDTKEVLSRFEVERQALALMDHPNIAKVHDGGVTSTGRPFFVMEYVKGIPITQFCDNARQTVQERLQLFVQVCQAVQHAHQKGIIHRDLKPSNILICLYDGLPIPKIIDFGLAKAMHQPLTENTLYTAHGVMVGTPLYMSPEQAEFNNLDVDTRTDIYSLGVILYELLTGTTPLERKQVKDAAFQEILRLIKEDDPQKPSTKISGSGSLPHIAAQRSLDPAQLSRVVKGDLDWIAMKSLEKDRSRRYETASGLARDVQRYLDDEPVEACPPSLGYKLRKLARRNTRALATAALLGVVVLGALAVVAGSIGWVVRDRQTRQAVVEREVLLALDEVQVAVDDNRDADVSVALNALKRAEGHLTSHEIREDVRHRVQQWKTDLAMAALLREIQLDKTAEDEDTMGKATTVAAYQRAFTGYNLDLDRLDNSQAIQRLRESPVKQHLLAALDDWALLQGTFDSASEHRNRRHASSRLLLLARDADNDPWRNELRVAIERNDIEALKKLAQQCDVSRHRPLTVALLGTRLRQAGQDDAFDVAIKLLGRAHELHPKEFCINQALGIAFLSMDSWRGELYLHPCAIQRPTNASIRTALGMALYENGYVEEAEKELREAIRLRPTYAEPHVRLGELLKYVKNLAGAEAEFRQAMKLNPQRYAASEKLKILLVEQQKLTEAAAVFQEAIDHSPQAAPAYFCLGDVLALLNKSSEAQAAYEQAARLGPSIAKKRRLAELKNAPAMSAPSSERLEEVSQHFAALVLKTPDSHGIAMQSAVLLLFLGKRTEYEALCRQMLERFGESEIPTAALRTSLTCLLSSPPVGDPARLEQLAQRGTDNGDTGKLAALLYGRGRGLAAYRAGRWEEAIKWCAESRNSGQGLNTAESVETHDLVIEAMAYHQLGNAAESRRLYEEANRLIRGRYPGAPTSLGDAWFDWVVYQILRQEAAALLGISPVDESSVDVHIALAQMHLNQGHWAEGAHHLDIVSEARPQDHLLAMRTAVLQLYQRDQKGYDRVCQRMLKQYGDTRDPVEADRTAKACLLANPPVGDLSQLVKLAETAVSDPKHGYYSYLVLVRALAAYRQGNWEECLTRCHAGQQRIGDPKQVPHLVAHYYLVQAMAQHRTGKLEGAKSSLFEAHKIISEIYPGAPNNLADRWADWMGYDILRREAELLIQPASLKPATSVDQSKDP